MAAETGSAAATLIERGRELALVQEMVEDAAAGRARFAVVEGAAGIGKSRLLAEVRAEAERRDFRLLTARGTDLERAFPFGVVRQLFEPVLARSEARERWLQGSADAAEPVFGSVAHDVAPQDVSFSALHGLYWLTLNIAADGPLALIVDDLHWADVPSLRFLSYVVRRLEDQPILLAVGFRSAAVGTDAVLLGEVADDPLATHLRPAPLTVDAVRELVVQRLEEEPAQEFAAACHDATGGNPLLLHELLKTFAAEGIRPSADHARFVRELGSRAISRTVLVRLARLSHDAVSVARTVSVLGEGPELGVLGQLAELDERRVAAATRELTRAEILRLGSPLGFVHPLVRDAIYGDLAAGERELLHARAADVLRAAGAPTEQVASHWLLLPRRGEAAVGAALHAAGRAAIAKGAPDTAVAYYRRALEEPLPGDERARVLLELGVASIGVSMQDSVGYTRDALAELTDPAARAVAALTLGRALFFTRTGDEAAAVVRDALAELPAGLDDMRRALEAMGLVSVNFGAAEPDLESRVRRLAGQPRAEGVGARMLDSVIGFESALLCLPREQCVAHALAALGDGSLVAADPGVGTLAAIVTLALAERPETMETWEGVQAAVHRGGSLEALTGMQLWRGWTLFLTGELAEAEESIRGAVQSEGAWVRDTGQGVIYTSSFLAWVLVERGDLAGAAQALARRGSSASGSDGAMFGALAEAELLYRSGRPAEAVGLLDAQAPYLPRVDNPAWMPWRSVKACALVALDRKGEAIALLEDDLERARRWGAPAPIGRALRMLGDLQESEGLLREAVEVFAGSANRLGYAKSLAALGTALRHDRRPTDAREPLGRALELAESCGATALVEHVRAELYATGARPRTAARVGAGSLTPSELRVAKLAADGKTNRDIAQTLYVTPKTVEVHLSSAYRKLGIRSRSALATALV